MAKDKKAHSTNLSGESSKSTKETRLGVAVPKTQLYKIIKKQLLVGDKVPVESPRGLRDMESGVIECPERAKEILERESGRS